MNRLFLALKAQLHDYHKLQTGFRGVINGRWVAKENLHITVCYFGDNYSIDELLEKLPTVVEKVEPLSIKSLGYFEHNNILYAKVQSKKLETLQASISDSFLQENTKLFIPHITLIRNKDIHNKKAFKHILKNYKNETIGTTDTAMELINSHIHSDGARYECIKRFES